MQAQAVLHFALAHVVQVRLPMAVLSQVFCDVRRQKNVPCIAAVEHPLRNIDPGSDYVGFVVNIRDTIDRPAVNAHAQLNVRMLQQCLADFERASHRLFWTLKE